MCIVFDGHDMMLEDGNNFRFIEEIVDGILAVQEFIQQIFVREAVGLDVDAVHH
jgi:hypothetical protein